ncbi:MAG: ATP-binding protein [Ferruginibacter sp.]|nr:ATP-binding protein [Ferruginibacter sp.]
MLFPLHNKELETKFEKIFSSLRILITARIEKHLQKGNLDINQWVDKNLDNDFSAINTVFIAKPDVGFFEKIILTVALIPHLQPNFFEPIIAEQLPNGGDFPEFGGIRATNHRSLLPTGETIQFILAGTNIEDRLKVQQYFEEEHFFFKQGILWLEPVKEGEPKMSGRIILAQDWIDKILFDKETAPRFGLDFPAKKIVTNMEWNDVVLHPHTLQQVNDIGVWLKFNHLVQDDTNLGRKIKPGYRVLFYGPSGTGKTLTTALLGRQFGKDVYRIDLSQIVSKFIGETEKNLETVFKKAETKDWILFFDEADALFGKRTNVSSAHDKYANQEVSYLLQRVEDYPGLLILASNFKSNLDDAFLRRFHSLVHFPMPVASERLMLWKKSMPENLTLHTSASLEDLAKQYEMTGASILNAVHFATLQCHARNEATIYQADLLEGIKKEFFKEERSFA